MANNVPITPTYLFYDIETTGLNACFDQVLQFAAIRTDRELKELERHEILIKLNKDVIPSPGAMITHRITVKQSQSGLAEIDAIKQIHQLLNTPGTISVGYNTLGFDDEFLRFAFYRNLLPPYTHQFANQCGRMDLYPIAIMYQLYKPHVIQWPVKEDGNPSLKLEHISAANQLATGQAHNAMVDVIATLELARRFITEREMWNYVIGYFDKNTDLERSAKLNSCFTSGKRNFYHALLICGGIGARHQYIAPVLSLGQHQHYNNQSLWLRLDLPELREVKADNIEGFTWVVRKKPAEQELLLPIHERFTQKVNTSRWELAQSNLQWLQENPELLEKICQYYQYFEYPKIPNIDIDAALYTLKFPSPREELLFRQFHAAEPKDKAAIVKEFPDEIRQEQALRILGRHYYETLSINEQNIFDEHMMAINASANENMPIDFRGRHQLSPTAALAEIAELETGNKILDDAQRALLLELKEFLQLQFNLIGK